MVSAAGGCTPLAAPGGTFEAAMLEAVEQYRRRLVAAAEVSNGVTDSLRIQAEELRSGKVDPLVVLAFAEEQSEVPTLAIMTRLERSLQAAAEAVREYRKEFLLALNRAKETGSGE